MTTHDVAFLVYPDRTAWKDTFLQNRDAAPVFMRAGVPVTTPAGSCCTCETSGDDVKLGCRQ